MIWNILFFILGNLCMLLFMYWLYKRSGGDDDET